MASVLSAHLYLILVLSAAVILTIAAWAVVHVAGTELRNAGTQLDKVAPVLAKFLTDVGSILWVVWCWLYTIRWKLQSWSLNKVTNTVIGFLVVASIYIVIDIVVDVVHIATMSDETIVERAPGLRQQLHLLPHYHAPIWLELTILGLAIVTVIHHWDEWKLRIKNFGIPTLTEQCLLELDKLRTPGTNVCSVAATEKFLDFVMTKMKEQLENDDKRKVEFSLMKTDSNGDLVMVFMYPAGAAVQSNLKLKIGEGGAGTAYRDRSAIYVPSTTHRMGINVDTNKTIGPIYKPDEPPTPIKCIFCVPVFRNGEVAAVLNVVCTKRSAFSTFQLNLCKLMGAIISTVG